MRCNSCGGPLGDGLFCSWCGQARAVEGARLLEALSIETVGDVASAMVPYGARVPTTYSDVFSTAEDGQRTFQVKLVVGNSPKASECRQLINLVLPLERPGPRGGPRIQLTITIEADGALSVVAHEQGAANPHRHDGFRVPTSR